jgi:hypothetical protein
MFFLGFWSVFPDFSGFFGQCSFWFFFSGTSVWDHLGFPRLPSDFFDQCSSGFFSGTSMWGHFSCGFFAQTFCNAPLAEFFQELVSFPAIS